MPSLGASEAATFDDVRAQMQVERHFLHHLGPPDPRAFVINPRSTCARAGNTAVTSTYQRPS